MGDVLRSSWIAVCFCLLLVAAGQTSLVVAQDEAAAQPMSPEKAQAQAWAAQVTGRHYYLKTVRDSFLINDQVDVVRCVIKPTFAQNIQTGTYEIAYYAKLWLEGVSPAPQEQIKLTIDPMKDLAELDNFMASSFSATPLEDAYDWPPEIKQAVRYRYIALGMNREMVELALGGLRYQADIEQLDDQRVRETWKLQLVGDTRQIYQTRTTYMDSLTSTSSQSYGTINTFISALGTSTALVRSSASASGSSTSTTTGSAKQSGFFIFSGLPPQFLNIVFTDGRVTARKTEFIK